MVLLGCNPVEAGKDLWLVIHVTFYTIIITSRNEAWVWEYEWVQFPWQIVWKLQLSILRVSSFAFLFSRGGCGNNWRSALIIKNVLETKNARPLGYFTQENEVTHLGFSTTVICFRKDLSTGTLVGSQRSRRSRKGLWCTVVTLQTKKNNGDQDP